MAVIIHALDFHSKRVLSGEAPATLTRPEAPAPEMKLVPPPPEVEIFALNALSWTGTSGQLRRVAKWNDVSLPKQAAERALAAGMAAPLSYARRGELRGYGGLHPEKHWCFDCDNDHPASESKTSTAPIIAFQTSVGQPYTIEHREAPTPMAAAARSLPREK